MERPIAVLRTSAGLQELRVAPTRPFTPPPRPSAAPAEPAPPFAFERRFIPLAEPRRRDRALLQTAWEALARVTRPDAPTLVHLITLLLGTVPWSSAPSRLPAPQLALPEPPPLRPTAAHPRAYRGTKHRPPRPPLPEPVDLRPFLDDPAQLRLVLQAFAPAFPAARAGLLAAGVRADRLALLEQALESGVDPSLLHHAGPLRRRMGSDAFRAHLLPSCLGASAAELTQAMALHDALRLDSRPELLLLVAALFADAGPSTALAWCRRLAAEPEAAQTLFLTHLLETRAFEKDPSLLRPGDLQRLAEIAPEAVHAHWHHVLFRGLAGGVPLDYLFTGFALARDRDPDFDFAGVQPCLDFPCDTFVATVDAQESRATVMDHERRQWLSFWKHAGQLPGFGALIAELPWDALGLEVVRAYLRALDGLVMDWLPPAEERARWAEIAAMARPLRELLLATLPAYRLNAISYFRDAVWSCETVPLLRRTLPRLLLVAERLCRPPFEAGTLHTPNFSRILGRCSEESMRGFLASPDGSFELLHKAFRRTRHRETLERGLSSLMEHEGEFCVTAFRLVPARLMIAARALGELSLSARAAVLRRLQGHPLSAPADGPFAILARLEAEGAAAPLPGKIRRLRPEDGERLSRAEPALRKQVCLARLRVVERAARETLAGGLPADLDEPNAVHALEILVESRNNRRSLRRFLAAHFAGESDYLERHPASRAWFAKNPTLDPRLWSEGITTTATLAPHGLVRVSTERDPLEVLKLGTYVGSCLAPGGLCTDSAASVVLDVNKQVLYVRDAGGAVVARQLVALSTAGELVCFSVYPRSASAAIKALFRQHDAALAAALGVPLHREATGAPPYAIALIIARDWWDDGLDGDAARRSSSREGAKRGN